MKHIKRHFVYTILLFVTTISLVSFKSFYNDKAPLEKIYTHTDRPFYFPGETIWFKSYLVTNDNTISSISDIMIAELISPKGVAVKKIRLSVENGYAYGDFHIDSNWVGGIYTLKTYTNWMQNFGEDSFFTKKITIQKVVKPNVLLNLKFEKEGYGKASQVIANFEAKDLKNAPLKHKEITFEVSTKGKKIISKQATTDKNGKSNIIFELPNDLGTTDVVLNTLVFYNGTTESISRSVPVVLDNIDLQFFPESGKLVANTNNNIAFKAINEFGKPVDISGDIVGERGELITTFNSFHDGMGAFNMLATNTRYYAKIKTPFVSERQISLPKVHQFGTRFSVVSDSLNTEVNLFSSEKKTLYLEITNASKTLFSKRINPSKKNVSINTKDFPIGIAKFSILDKNKTIVAERLVFLNAHKQLKVAIKLGKSIYKTREKVKATILTTDVDDNPIPSNISVSVADNKLVSFADDKQDHILSSLLLSSELKGKIHKPSFYFNPKEVKSYAAIDYVMLTHGWRDYINNPKLSYETAAFKPEKTGVHSGIVVDKKEKPVKAKLLLFNQDGYNVLVFETSEKGEFQFKAAAMATLTLLAYTDDGKKLDIIKNEFKKGVYSNANNKNQANNSKAKQFLKNDKPLQSPIKKEATANISLNEDIAALDEVVVIGYGVSTKKEITGSVSQIQNDDISEEGDLANTLQGRVAGLAISEGFNSGSSASKIRIRGVNTITGNSAPLIIIDGVPHNESSLSNIEPSQVNSVSVLKDAASTAIYGSRGANGVILITTKNQSFYRNWGKKKLNNAKFNNYASAIFYNYDIHNSQKTYTAKVFYVPKYDSEVIPEERTDFRQTIYWNPVVQTDENGKAEFEFYNSDAITSFKITAEGIGFNGLVGRKEKTYATNKLLSVDFKAPNYMALDDTVVLPVSITNDTEKNIKGNLELKLPKHLKLAENFDTNITMEAKKTLVKNIKVVPIKKGEDITIQVSLRSKHSSDIVKRKSTILSPYFPTEMSISGSKSQVFSFNINNKVNNSLEAEFNIYTDIVGDIMDGIEGIIRKPYGCFEQTSSATYPNIMVLKYLKESGRSNPEIEKKAISFIKKGYKRLVSYETKEGGFEWFGGTPPHETLTAYGILEFTEMKEVYSNVDQRMINRTVKWLLNQKDGKGGFNKSKRGFSSFSRAPQTVINAYILYALTEAKVKSDITLEYNAAYKEALKSEDPYEMALLAVCSFNLKEKEKALILVEKIKNRIDKKGFDGLNGATTMTRSYGNSKNIETVAFSILALIKAESTSQGLIKKGVDYLLGKRRYNSFGSTQATIMSLKALIEYTKTQKRKLINKNDAIELIVNGKSLSQKIQSNENGKIVIDGFSKYLSQGQQNIEVNFTNSKNTFPYSLNVKWDSSLPNTSGKCPLNLETTIAKTPHKVGDNVSMSINVSNKKDEKLGMVTAIIGIPSGTTAQPWQLKEILEQNRVAYYEIFDNYLVFYWRDFDATETKTIRLDLKADIAGSYKAPASTAYLYYGDEFKTWIFGNSLEILE